MPGGLDEAAAIIAVITLCARLFEGAVEGLILLKKARGFQNELVGIHLMIDIQLLHLDSWAKEVGLCHHPPTLSMGLAHAQIVSAVLERLLRLATDLDSLQRVYGLKLEQSREPSNENTSHQDVSGVQDLEIQGDLKQELTDTFQRVWGKRREPWMVLRWVTYDSKKVQTLADQFARLIDELYKMLDRPRQAKVARAIEAVERSVVLNSANDEALDTIRFQRGAIEHMSLVAAAANLRKEGLQLGVIDPGMTANKTPKVRNMRLSAEALSIPMSNTRATRYLAHYHGQPVLVELKTDGVLKHDVLRDRVRKVSAFLSNLDASFHGLKCRGYLRLHDCYAYVFKIPDASFSRGVPVVRSLRQALDQFAAPSLNSRVSIAIILLETALQLHTSGWMHKEIRSESVLFVGPGSSRVVDDSILDAPIYVAGYSLARNDDPQESTEPLESEAEADLYRHPRSLGPRREAYHKLFDVFSIGCVLLEVGLWRSLPALLREQPDHLRTLDKDGRPDLLASRRQIILCSHEIEKSTVESQTKSEKSRIGHAVLRQLEAAAGRTYAHIVTQCFREADNKARGDRAVLEFEMYALEQLRALSDAL